MSLSRVMSVVTCLMASLLVQRLLIKWSTRPTCLVVTRLRREIPAPLFMYRASNSCSVVERQHCIWPLQLKGLMVIVR